MKPDSQCQIVISGVGGQGVLFITRLLAEAAIARGLPVFTSETHGMAQRGGTVISHLKVGDFTSPLITPGRADGLIALKAETLHQYHGFLKPGGWVTVNSPSPLAVQTQLTRLFFDADRVAQEINDIRSLNIIMLGFTLACAKLGEIDQDRMWCTMDDIAAVLAIRLKGRPQMLQSALNALRAGEKKD
jgi:indolepyruvate ferredoxin oxidoreductase beta subunit